MEINSFRAFPVVFVVCTSLFGCAGSDDGGANTAASPDDAAGNGMVTTEQVAGHWAWSQSAYDGSEQCKDHFAPEAFFGGTQRAMPTQIGDGGTFVIESAGESIVFNDGCGEPETLVFDGGIYAGIVDSYSQPVTDSYDCAVESDTIFQLWFLTYDDIEGAMTTSGKLRGLDCSEMLAALEPSDPDYSFLTSLNDSGCDLNSSVTGFRLNDSVDPGDLLCPDAVTDASGG